MKLTFRFLLGCLMLSMSVVPAARAAEGADTAYVVTYFEIQSPATAKALALLRQLSKASRKEAENLRFEVLRQIDRPDQFAILDAWKNKDAQAAHAAAAHTVEFRDKLKPLLRGPYDERPHITLDVAAMPASHAGAARKSALYAVTHVDVVGKEKDNGAALVKQLSEDGRKDKGNVRFDSLTQTSRPNHMTAIEIWDNQKALDAHGITAHKKAFREKLAPLSGSLYDERLYRAVD